jgi:hypothetical protein
MFFRIPIHPHHLLAVAGKNSSAKNPVFGGERIGKIKLCVKEIEWVTYCG